MAKKAELETGPTSVGCAYLKRLSYVDNDVLTELVTRSIGNIRAQ